MTTFIQTRERRNTHVLGLSRFMVPAACVIRWQVLLDRNPGSADRGLGTSIQFVEQADVILQARKCVSGWSPQGERATNKIA